MLKKYDVETNCTKDRGFEGRGIDRDRERQRQRQREREKERKQLTM